MLKTKKLLYLVIVSLIIFNPNIFADITVSGEGTVSTKPNTASFSVNIETKAKTAKEAAVKNAESTDKTMKLLKSLLPADDAVTTQSYTIYPETKYDREQGKSEIIGYRVSNTIFVTTNDIINIGNLLDKTTASGITSINNLSFSYNNPEEIYNQALTKAVSNAKTRANIVAKAGNLKILSIKNITVQGYSYNPPSPMPRYAMAEARADIPTPIETPSVKTMAQVEVVFSTG